MHGLQLLMFIWNPESLINCRVLYKTRALSAKPLATSYWIGMIIGIVIGKIILGIGTIHVYIGIGIGIWDN